VGLVGQNPVDGPGVQICGLRAELAAAPSMAGERGQAGKGPVEPLVAAAGLAGREITGSPAADAAASALIGLILLATSLVLLHTNRELLTGRAVSLAQADAMRRLIGNQSGVLAVSDLFAIVVGPSSLIVDADVVFDDELNVPEVEDVIVAAAAALRARWPTVVYAYLNPVAQYRPRRFTPR
jgi:divalent metal cation (Fe/Co/Zn/Cd) transporter